MFRGKRNAVGRSVSPCGVLSLETRQRNTERRKTRRFAEGRRVNYMKTQTEHQTSGPRQPAALCLNLVPQTDVLRASGGVRRKRGGRVSIYHIAHKSALPKRQTRHTQHHISRCEYLSTLDHIMHCVSLQLSCNIR